MSQIWVYGNSYESFLVAVVNPSVEALEHWAEANGIAGDFNSLCENPKAKAYILGELNKIGKEKKVCIRFLISSFGVQIFSHIIAWHIVYNC